MSMPEPIGRRFAEIAVGDRATLTARITANMVDAFAALSGDYNPLHTDEAYASATPFKGRVAHGMIAGALFSRLVGMQLPGLYCVYLSQSLQFKKPILLDTEALVTGEVAAKSEAAHTLTLALALRDAQSNDLLVAGEALVRVLQ